MAFWGQVNIHTNMDERFEIWKQKNSEDVNSEIDIRI